MSTLRPFCFDPLVDWVKHKGKKQSPDSSSGGEIVNDKGVETLKAIEERLDGKVKVAKSKRSNSQHKNSNVMNDTPLSVTGQVGFLINEATSFENLSQMYYGWSPYL